MRRPIAWAGRVLAILLLLPLALIAAAWIGLNTTPGRYLAERMVARLSGEMVRIEGLSGHFPQALRLAQVTVSDAEGVYLTAREVALDWSPARLVQARAAIDRLEAEHVTLTRLPRAEGGQGGTALPAIQVELNRLRVARLDIAAAVAGQALALRVEGTGSLTAPDTGQGRLTLTALNTGLNRGTSPATASPDTVPLASLPGTARPRAPVSTRSRPRPIPPVCMPRWRSGRRRAARSPVWRDCPIWAPSRSLVSRMVRGTG